MRAKKLATKAVSKNQSSILFWCKENRPQFSYFMQYWGQKQTIHTKWLDHHFVSHILIACRDANDL